MPILRFPGLAKSANLTNKDYLQRITGYTLVKAGDDWIVPENDVKLNAGPSDVLRYERKAISVSNSNYDHIADLFIKYTVDELEKDLDSGKYGGINIDGSFGLKSNIDYHRIKFLVYKIQKNELRRYIVAELLPFMSKEMGARYATPLNINATYQQGIISLSRLAISIEKFGIDHIKSRVDNKKIYSNLLPSPMDILSYVESLMIFAPFAVTLPFSRVGSKLHFFCENIWAFSGVATTNIYESFLSEQNPLPVIRNSDYLNLHRLGSYGGRKYFSTVAKGVNNLMRYLNNPLNHVNDNGIIDHQRLIQLHSSVHLLFADLVSINCTNNNYSKIRLSLSYLDKLSNIKRNASLANKISEAAMFSRIMSLDYGDKLAIIIGKHFGNEYDKLGAALKSATLNAYSNIHKCLSALPEIRNGYENDRLELLRCIRNTAHGSFLDRKQFENVLFSDLTVPHEISYLPLLLTLGLILEPKEFLEL